MLQSRGSRPQWAFGELRTLVASLLRRDIESRHKGTFGGIYWYVFQNLVLIVIYSSVFGAIFRTRWLDAGVIEGNFAIAVFIGLIMYNLASESLNAAPTLIIKNANLVKKVVFPLVILPVVSIGSALFNVIIGFTVLCLATLVLGVPLSWRAVWVPFIVLPLAVLCLGLSWFLAALGTYVRDVGQVVALLITGLMFFSPLFYPRATLPEYLQSWLILNPLTVPIEQARNVLLFGREPDLSALSLYLAVALVIAAVGCYFFKRTSGGFADVL